ncbi:hypothetical protein [Pseudomonas sp. NW5]|uniref:hypothetical protein n=1 Tax=Pseudomonas sp. NW5 TaxID=2934934 RepID=UPI002021F8CC|nr:hypothetical protein [Pseudomonas sp. NW5]MCL7462211.1 hypothetical protein [Pseudomonas sp. NW5]
MIKRDAHDLDPGAGGSAALAAGRDAQQLPVERVRMESTTLAGEIGVGEIVEPLVEVEKL